MTSKLQQLKQAIKNPPPERLASIEYKSHGLQAIGITFVCVFLIFKGFWYIIFAFIFGVGISYSQGMAAYSKYKMIMSMKPEEKIEDFVKDSSPTRRRSKIIKHVFGNYVHWFVIIAAVVVAVGTIPITLSRWALMFWYPVVIASAFIFFYFYFAYWFALPIYLNELKGGERNGKKENNKSKRS